MTEEGHSLFPIVKRKSYIRKMYIVCQNAKYGCGKRGKKCDQIHLTDICEKNELCREKFCDKWHPIGCFYYKKYG